MADLKINEIQNSNALSYILGLEGNNLAKKNNQKTTVKVPAKSTVVISMGFNADYSVFSIIEMEKLGVNVFVFTEHMSITVVGVKSSSFGNDKSFTLSLNDYKLSVTNNTDISYSFLMLKLI